MSDEFVHTEDTRILERGILEETIQVAKSDTAIIQRVNDLLLRYRNAIWNAALASQRELIDGLEKTNGSWLDWLAVTGFEPLKFPEGADKGSVILQHDVYVERTVLERMNRPQDASTCKLGHPKWALKSEQINVVADGGIAKGVHLFCSICAEIEAEVHAERQEWVEGVEGAGG